MFKHRLAPGLLLGAALLIASPAQAAESSTDAIVAECAQGDGIQPGHSAAELSAAIENLPADVAEYTDCADQLIAARRMVLDPSRVSTAPLSTTPGFAPSTADASVDDASAPTSPSDAASATSAPVQTSISGAIDVEPEPADDAQANRASDVPVGTRLGGLAAAGIVGASLLGLWRPAMLRRHEADEE